MEYKIMTIAAYSIFCV